MKLRDRVVVGFCLSLVLVTVLFVVDLQNENARRLAAVENYDGGGSVGDGAGIGLHGRSDRSKIAGHAQSAWDAASSLVMTTLMPSLADRPADDRHPRPAPWTPSRPAAPQPYPHVAISADDYPPVPDPYAGDRFYDLAERLTRSESLPHRGNVVDWTAVRDVIVDDTYEDGSTSNEYVVEYLEQGLR